MPYTKVLSNDEINEFTYIKFHCEDGFSPYGVTAEYYCKRSGRYKFIWVPVFEPLHCTALKLTLYERSTNFKCPSDFISYKCTVNSSDPNAYLKWHIEYPGLSTQTIVYNRNSITKTSKQIKFYANVILNVLLKDRYMESTISFIPTDGIDFRRIQLNCSTINIEKSILEVADEFLSGMLCTMVVTHVYIAK